MADTSTTHLGLIKQDPDSRPDIEKEHDNLDVLDEEVFARGKKFNGESVGEDGEFHIRSIPYADNLESSSSQRSEETYAIRTSGGEASINDGDAWLMLIRGDRIHTGYTPMEIDMQVIPMVRPAPPAITATLDEETFEAYVGEAGTYTITYTDSWSTSPTLYGLTVSNVPVDGDSITMDWDGENDAVVTVDAVERQAPDAIDATIDEDVFVGYVSQSGTTTLTYSTAWSADPANYGITIIGEPVAGDVITIDYTKEVRGTIIQSDPQTFISTGWNLYNHELGYARVIKYHDNYGFKVSGTYTMLEFATTTTGSRIVINPVSGGFAVPSDGYVFVTGGNDEDTQIWMTWSDWGTTANGGEYAPYSETQVDISTFMATNFPFGLLRAGNARDEINLNTGIAVSNVTRQVYNAQNLANINQQKLEAQENSWNTQIADYENRLGQLEQQELENERWEKEFAANREDAQWNKDFQKQQADTANNQWNLQFNANREDTQWNKDFQKEQADLAKDQWNQQFAANRDDTAWNQAFQQGQADISRDQWEREFGYNTASNEKQIAMQWAMNILSNGEMPSDDVLTAAGLSREDAAKMKAKKSGGSGKGGSKTSPDAEGLAGLVDKVKGGTGSQNPADVTDETFLDDQNRRSVDQWMFLGKTKKEWSDLKELK